MKFRLLGAVDLRDAESVEVSAALAQPKRVALLAFLAIASPRGKHRRDRVLALFWPELDDARARKALNQAAHHIRRAVGADVLVSGDDDTLAVARNLVWCDVIAFEEALARGALDEALELYRGPLLDGFFLGELQEFGDWVERERARLARQAADAAWTLADRAADRGDADVALEWGQRALALRGDERGTQRLITLHDRVGDRAGAIRAYEHLAEQLRVEYDAEPAPETQALIAAVRARHVPTTNIVGSPARPLAPVVPVVPVVPVLPVVQMLPAVPAQTPPTLTSRWRVRAGARATLVVLGVLAIATVIGITTYRHRSARPAGRLIAVFPFRYSGGPDLAYLGEAITNLVSSDLNGAGQSTTDQRVVAHIAGDVHALTPATAAALTDRLRADTYILGDVTEIGHRIQITASVHTLGDSSAAPRELVVEGESTTLFELVDELTAGLMLGRTSAYRSAAVTTHSLDALRDYVRGTVAFREGRYEAAVDAFRRAVDIDTAFALAYLRLAQAANWTGQNRIAVAAASRAESLSSRLSGHDLRTARAWRAYFANRVTLAESLYTSLLREDPNDIEAQFYLAELHFHWAGELGRVWTASRADWERVLSLDPENGGALTHLARIAAADHDERAFEAVAARALHLEPDAQRGLEIQLLRAFAFGDHAARVAAARALSQVRDDLALGLVGTAAVASQDLSDVNDLLLSPIVSRRAFADRWVDPQCWQVAVFLARGQSRAALSLIDSLVTLHAAHPRVAECRGAAATITMPAAPAARRRSTLAANTDGSWEDTDGRYTPQRLYVAGLLSGQLGDTMATLAHAAALDAFVFDSVKSPTHMRYAKRYAHLLRADVLRREHQPMGALAAMPDARTQSTYRIPDIWAYGAAHERLLRGELLSDAGRLAEALPWFENFPDVAAYDFAYLPRAILDRAQTLARLRRYPEAAAQYERLLKLWKDADPELAPVILDVRARLDRARAGSS